MANDNHDWGSLDIAIQRLEHETPEAYQAFLQYAWLQGVDRCIRVVAEKTGFSVGNMRIWSTDNHWVDRAATIDGLRWMREYKEREKLLEQDNLKFAEENRKIKEKGLRAANKMIDVADHLLQSAEMVDDIIETGHVMTADNRRVPTHTVIKMKAKISDIPRLVDTAIKTSRLVQDLPTEIIENHLPIGTDLRNLSTEDLLAMRERNQQILREKGAASRTETISDANN